MRSDGRNSDQLRQVNITRDYTCYAEGSVLIEFGKTNFKLLPNQIKSKIIPPFFLKIYKILPTSTLIWKLKLLNRLIGSQNITLMKLIMGLSIVKGYKK